MDKRGLIVFIMLFLITILFSQLISAGPYGYGDSMDLKYKVDQTSQGKIISYGYGDEIKYMTSLKPKGINWSEWKPENRRMPVNLTWEEIDEAIKNNQSIEEFLKEKQKSNFILNNLVTSLVDKVSNFFLGLIITEEVSIESVDGMCIKEDLKR